MRYRSNEKCRPAPKRAPPSSRAATSLLGGPTGKKVGSGGRMRQLERGANQTPGSDGEPRAAEHEETFANPETRGAIDQLAGSRQHSFSTLDRGLRGKHRVM